MVYELRHYVAAAGKSEAMLALMEKEVLPIFRRLGFKTHDFWVDARDARHLWYVMSWDSAAAIEAGWTRFRADPEWLRVKAGAGPVIETVESIPLERLPW